MPLRQAMFGSVPDRDSPDLAHLDHADLKRIVALAALIAPMI